MSSSNMSGRNWYGYSLMFVGAVMCLSVVGAPVGLVLMAIGFILLLSKS